MDLTITITCMIGICFRELNGIEMILIAGWELQNAGVKSQCHNCVPNSGKYKRIVNKNEVRHSQKVLSFIAARPHL